MRSQQPRMLGLQEAFLLTPARTPSHPWERWLRPLSKVKFVFNTYTQPSAILISHISGYCLFSSSRI